MNIKRQNKPRRTAGKEQFGDAFVHSSRRKTINASRRAVSTKGFAGTSQGADAFFSG